MEKQDIKKIIVRENYLSNKKDFICANEEEIVCVILINKQLKNNILANCCRIFNKMVNTYEKCENHNQDYNEWMENNQPIIIKEAMEQDLLYCVNNYHDENKRIWCKYNFEDTANKPLTVTCACFIPLKRNKIPNFIKKNERN